MQLQTGIHTATAKRNPQTRILSIGIVVALHIVALYAILNGVADPVKRVFIDPIWLPPPHVTPSKPQPPPPTGTFLKPVAPPNDGPIIDIDRSNTITDPPPRGGTQDGGEQSIPPTSAQGIGATHTIPPYPTMAIRLNEQGTATLRLAIAADGSVTDASVQTSSGSARLDEAAIAWVKSHWRYKPATRDGTAIASTIVAAVKFDLRNAR